MKDLLFKKTVLVPLLMAGVFALFSSCDKDKDDDSEGKSLAVTVNFTGTKVPSAGEQLMVVLVYSPLSEVDMENVGPDKILTHTLTANDITSGVTLTFTEIDPAKAEVYVAAFVDSDGDGSPEPGELLECYQDVSALDALTGKANATNVAGKKAITINLDQIITTPSLAVTVNFTGTTIPKAGDEMQMVLFYSSLSEFNPDTDNPDDMLFHTLTSGDITSGITLTFTDINPFAEEIYVAVLVDSDGDGSPGNGELAEFYQDVSAFDVLTGKAEAKNVAGKTAITINLDQIITGPSLAVTVNFTGTKPEVGNELMVVLVYSPFPEIDMDNNESPGTILFHTLTNKDITDGVTLTFEDIDPFAEEIYISAVVDFDGDGNPGPGDLLECYQDKNAINVLTGKEEATNVAGETAITINLDEILTAPSLAVTVNFTGTKPEAGKELMVVLVYSPFPEVDMENDGPDKILTHTLIGKDITDGVTLTFEDIDPFATEIYIAAFVDSDGNGSPGAGELLECYQDVSAFDVLTGKAKATNVAGETAITINLNLVL